MKRPVVMFDVDGVLADFVYSFTVLANRLYGTPVTLTDDQPRWDGFPGMTPEQIDETWAVINRSPDFWTNVKPAVATHTFDRINSLQDKANVYFTTNRKDYGTDTAGQTWQWLQDNGVLLPSVVLVEKKGELARSINADFLIDDKAGNAIYAAYHAAPKLKSYILDRPYNQFDNNVIGSKVTRVYTVKDFLDDVEKSL